MATTTRPRVALPRVGFLDGLRGVAALLVVFCHTTGALFPKVVFGGSPGGLTRLLYETPIVNLPFQGHFMVCVFYALSGLALSYHTIGRRNRTPAVSGAFRRYPRLMIPVLSGILLAAAMLALNLFPVHEASQISGSVWWGRYWQFTPSFHSAFYEGTVGVFKHALSPYDPPLWTMHSEFLGSLLVFAVLLLSPRRWVRVAAYVVLAVLTRHGYLLAFVGGMAICEIWMAKKEIPRQWGWAMLPLGIYGLILGSYPIPSSTTPHFYNTITPGLAGPLPLDEQLSAHVIGAILVVAAVVAFAPARDFLEWRSMLFLGRVSFALYILHFLVLGSVGAGLLIALNGGAPYFMNAAIVFMTVVIVSIAASWLFTRVIDEPAVALLGRMYRTAAAWVTARWQALATRRGEPVGDAAPTIEPYGS